ncbi:TetR/AcrR family transcriptional regulator [Kitasatospora kazusensis]|uniref:TetR/AcrR family transcriptional regulator n=1 Tax=Kitasatospora kazusensis TaxID=407974 RepID=A0ABN3A248_9ACTN
MGAKGEETRARLVRATRDLMEAQGYSGTGLNQVLTESGAPRGSLYFHFPGGKDELVGEALTEAGREIGTLIATLTAAMTGTDGAAALVGRLMTALGDRMEQSGYTKGCPLAIVALEVSASNEPLRRACADGYAGWQQSLAELLVDEGYDPARADASAGAVLALVEGSLLLARVQRSRTPLDQGARAAAALLA